MTTCRGAASNNMKKIRIPGGPRRGRLDGRQPSINIFEPKFARSRLRDFAGGSNILIAGCGTGQHAIETAQRFSPARVLAIDLSLSSLAYAKRQTRAIGLDTIEYAQADILKLESIERSLTSSKRSASCIT